MHHPTVQGLLTHNTALSFVVCLKKAALSERDPKTSIVYSYMFKAILHHISVEILRLIATAPIGQI